MNGRRLLLTATAVLLAAGAATAAEHAASVRAVAGELELERPSETAAGPASRNQPVIEGDRLTTSADGRAEIVLSDGSRLFLDRGTRVDLVDLEPSPLLRVWRGAVALDVAELAAGEEPAAVPRIDTRAGTMFALEPGRYRVSVERDGLVYAAVESGLAEVRGAGSSVLVRSGERITAVEDEAPESPYVYNTASRDDFDDWLDQRREGTEITLTWSDAEQDLPPAARPYAYELESNGDWRYYAPYQRYVWTPQAAVGWRPWVDGYWTPYPDGLTWISPEPWGYVTYHYGAWDWATGFGWFWVPGRNYGPAWVDWYVYDHHVAWCPPRSYGYWNHHGHHRGGVEIGHDYISRPEHWDRTVVVDRDRLTGSRVRDNVVSPERVRSLEPLFRSDRLKRTPDGLAPAPSVSPSGPGSVTTTPPSGRSIRTPAPPRPSERTPWGRRAGEPDRVRSSEGAAGGDVPGSLRPRDRSEAASPAPVTPPQARRETRAPAWRRGAAPSTSPDTQTDAPASRAPWGSTRRSPAPERSREVATPGGSTTAPLSRFEREPASDTATRGWPSAGGRTPTPPRAPSGPRASDRSVATPRTTRTPREASPAPSLDTVRERLRDRLRAPTPREKAIERPSPQPSVESSTPRPSWPRSTPRQSPRAAVERPSPRPSAMRPAPSEAPSGGKGAGTPSAPPSRSQGRGEGASRGRVGSSRGNH